MADDRPAAEQTFDPTLALGAAAHEIKNLLGPLGVTLQLAERRAAAGQPVAPEELAFARAQVQRLSRLVNDLLDVTRLDVEQFPVRPHDADLAATLRDAVEAFRRGNARDVVLSLPAQPVSAAFDPDRLHQVVLNLLDNAAKYSPPPAPITVTLTRGAGAARVEIRDRGPGLDAAAQAAVFQRFVRARGEGDGTRGLGLGLYLCRVIAERHGGRIGVDSQPGHGAAFWLEIPAP